GLTVARVAVGHQDGGITRGFGRGHVPTTELQSVLGVQVHVLGTVDHLTGGGWIPSGGQVDEGALTTPDEPSEQRECSPDDGGHDQGAAQAGMGAGVGGCAHEGSPPGGSFVDSLPVVEERTLTACIANLSEKPCSGKGPESFVSAPAALTARPRSDGDQAPAAEAHQGKLLHTNLLNSQGAPWTRSVQPPSEYYSGFHDDHREGPSHRPHRGPQKPGTRTGRRSRVHPGWSGCQGRPGGDHAHPGAQADGSLAGQGRRPSDTGDVRS